MPEEAKHDPLAGRYDPPADLKAYAHNRMLEQESPHRRYQRQRWEEAMAGVRVALAAMREIHPGDTDFFEHDDRIELQESLHFLDNAHVALSALQETMLGRPMHYVLRANVRSIDEYKEIFEDSDDQA